MALSLDGCLERVTLRFTTFINIHIAYMQYYDHHTILHYSTILVLFVPLKPN